MNKDNEQVGFLTVAVKTANGALPVPNAEVTIYAHSRLDGAGAPLFDPSDVIYTLTTDQNGRSEKVALKTVSSELSQVPSDDTTYLGYTIYVYADGFYNTELVNVPIFQGIHSIQNVNLIPLSEFSSFDDVNPNDGRIYSENSSFAN